MKCKKCNGTGIVRTKREIMQERRSIALDLHRRGNSYRAIAKKIGYKNPWSAWKLIKNGNKARAK